MILIALIWSLEAFSVFENRYSTQQPTTNRNRNKQRCGKEGRWTKDGFPLLSSWPERKDRVTWHVMTHTRQHDTAISSIPPITRSHCTHSASIVLEATLHDTWKSLKSIHPSIHDGRQIARLNESNRTILYNCCCPRHGIAGAVVARERNTPKRLLSVLLLLLENR